MTRLHSWAWRMVGTNIMQYAMMAQLVWETSTSGMLPATRLTAGRTKTVSGLTRILV